MKEKKSKTKKRICSVVMEWRLDGPDVLSAVNQYNIGNVTNVS